VTSAALIFMLILERRGRKLGSKRFLPRRGWWGSNTSNGSR